MDDAFKGPRLKIKRANQHICNINDVLNAFVQTDFYSLAVEHEGNTGDYVLQFKQVRETPCELPLIIGDAIHNLRSALDIAYCELVAHVGGTPTDWTRFMFFKDRQELVDRLGKGVMQCAPDIVDLLADVVKPYLTANNPLCALHDLDIADKHLLLLPIFSVARLQVTNLRLTGLATVTIGKADLILGKGGILKVVGMPVRFEMQFDDNMKPSFKIAFGKGQALEGQPVIPTLHQLSQLVSGVIDTFAHAISTRRKADF